jgi:hypothetical protein
LNDAARPGAGLRAKLQPKAKDTYELLARVLREESGVDLERTIAEEERRAHDWLAVVHENGGDRGNQHTGGKRQPDNVSLATDHGNSCSCAKPRWRASPRRWSSSSSSSAWR